MISFDWGMAGEGLLGEEIVPLFNATLTFVVIPIDAGVAEPAIKMPNVARRAAALPPDIEPPRLLNPGGYAQAAAVGHYLLDLGDEACHLCQSVAV